MTEPEAKGSASPFWRFSLALYRQPGAPDACIALQDKAGVDVNVMLFALWLATQGRALDAGDLAAIDAAVARWRAEAVVPLRAVRRAMREPPAGFAGTQTAALREKVKAVELESERLQQEALFALKPAQDWGRREPDEDTAARANLAAYASMLGVRFEQGPQAAMRAALAALRTSA